MGNGKGKGREGKGRETRHNLEISRTRRNKGGRKIDSEVKDEKSLRTKDKEGREKKIK